MNYEQLPYSGEEEYQTKNNDFNEIPQSIELSGEEEGQELNPINKGYIHSKTELEENEEMDYQQNQYQFNNLVNDHCINLFITSISKPKDYPADNQTDNISQTNEIRELIQIINTKNKTINQLIKQNDQLKKTVSNLVIQTKQSKAFDKINHESNLRLTYADMILALPSLKKDLEIKETMVKKLDSEMRQLTLSLENTEGENSILKEKSTKLQKTIDSLIKTNNKLLKEKEINTSLIEEKQDKIEAITNQLIIYKELDDKRKLSNKIIQQESFYFLYDNSSSIKEIDEGKRNLIKQQKLNDRLIQDNEVLIAELNKEREKNKEYEITINEKSSDEIEYKNDINSLIQKIDDYENEIKYLNENIGIITTDKTKNETFYLNQITQLQNERNYFESLLHFNPNSNMNINKLTTSSSKFNNKNNNTTGLNQSINILNQAEMLHDIFNTLSESNDALNQLRMNNDIDYQMIYQSLKNIIKTLNIAYTSISQLNNDLQSYRNDNKKLYDDNQSLINHNAYLNSIIEIISNKHIANKSIGITIKSLIGKQIEMNQLQKAKAKLKTKLSSYASFIQTMNSTSTTKESQIPFGYNKNYLQNDFSEVSSYNNALMDIEMNINQIHSDILGLENEFNLY